MNVKVTIFNLKEVERLVTNGKEIILRKAMATDLTRCMAITFFWESVDQIENAKPYKITKVSISIFNGNRVFKTTETSEITDDKDSQVTSDSNDDSWILKHSKWDLFAPNAKTKD